MPLTKQFIWPFNSRFKRWILLYLPLVTLTLVYSCDQIVTNAASGNLYTNPADIPNVDAALVLGTSPRSKGEVNLYYKYRMEAAAELWKAGKVKYIIVSGDNSTVQYDEASYMRETLKELGVPDSVITLDFAGFRTLDSVVRAYWVFGQKNIVVISQEFHNERAVYLASEFGIHAIGLNAKDVPGNYGWATSMREYLARVKAVLDVKVFGTTPKFPGPPEPIARKRN